jgi:uncharacterized protein (DUF433 family)
MPARASHAASLQNKDARVLKSLTRAADEPGEVFINVADSSPAESIAIGIQSDADCQPKAALCRGCIHYACFGQSVCPLFSRRVFLFSSQTLIRFLENPLQLPVWSAQQQASTAANAASAKKGAAVPSERGRTLGIGGIFFKSANQQQLREWYGKHFGLADKGGGRHDAMAGERQPREGACDRPVVVVPANTEYFEPSQAAFMVNYIVDDLDALLERCREKASRSIPTVKTKTMAGSRGSTIPTATRSNCGSRLLQTRSSGIQVSAHLGELELERRLWSVTTAPTTARPWQVGKCWTRKEGVSIMPDIDWSDCPIVERNPKKLGGVPTVRAWRLSADSIVENHDDGESPEEIADMFEVPIEDVRTILAYAAEFRHSAHPVR